MCLYDRTVTYTRGAICCRTVVDNHGNARFNLEYVNFVLCSSKAMKMTTTDDVVCNCKRRGMSERKWNACMRQASAPLAVLGYAH